MPKPVAALDYLASPTKHPVLAFCVVFGDETFLKRQTLHQLREQALVGEDADFSCTEFSGDDVELRTVLDELSTRSMFGGDKSRRMVIVGEADGFVTKHRTRLEELAQHPLSSGVFILEVKTWPSNTRLFKSLSDKGLQIECKEPTPGAVGKWLISWAKQKHNTTLASDAAEQLLEIIGPEMGLLDQELAKLALVAAPTKEGKGLPTISAQLVRENVGGWRAKTVWDMLDAAAGGNAPEALRQLDRLLSAGEQVLGVFGPISSSLRRFSTATRAIQQAEAQGRKIPLTNALEQAGVKAWPAAMQKAESQMKQLGRHRGSQMLRWLLDLDLALKGTSSAPHRARFALEQLIARMAKTSTKP